MKTKNLTRISLMIALLIISAQLAIPIGPVSITLQSLVILVIGLIFPKKQAVLTAFLYLLMGLMGFPIFAQAMGGPYSIFLPSFGFILSFIPALWLMGKVRERESGEDFKRNLSAVLLGNLVIYFVGILYMSFILIVHLGNEMTLWEVLSLGMIPFIPADIAKSILALSIAKRVTPYFKNEKKSLE